MNSRAVVRQIARRVPSDLKQLRGKLMLEVLCESLGVAEVRCPGCAGTGWLSRRALERCPLCCGFREVPDRLAEWFEARYRRALARREGGPPPARRLIRPERVAAPPPERCGRLAEIHYHVHLPEEVPER